MKKWLPHIGIGIGLIIAVYALFFSSSEEDKIRAKLDLLETAVAVEGQTNPVVRGARIKDAFSAIFIKQVAVEIPELTQAKTGRTELVGLATQAPLAYETVSVDLGGLEIRLDQTALSAVAFGDAVLTGTRRSGELQRDDRQVSLRFDKIDGDWLIVSLTVSAKDEIGYGDEE
jgi:hypothetical protein